MRKLIISLILSIPVSSVATPYFRVPFINSQPVVNVGACADMVNVGHSEQCTMMGVINHGSKDGYWIIPGEDWTLLAVGYAASGTGAKLVIGPSWNISPMVMGGLVQAADAFAPNSALATELHSFLDNPISKHLSGSFGPAFSWDPMAGPGGHGYFRIFAGASWKF